MSWCRWSSMDWACDLYVYESDAGVEIHVAGNRAMIDPADMPPRVHYTDPKWVDRHVAVMALLDAAPRERIKLPHAGESFTCSDLNEAADTIDMLTELGYVCPPRMASEMRAAAQEVDQ